MAWLIEGAVLERFGRYPSRNEALGRESTKEEEQFLKDGPGWGKDQPKDDKSF